MAFVSIPSADIAAGKPVDVDLMANIKDNDDALNAAAAGAIYYDIPNGDMELTDAGFPANWASTTYPGGTAELATTSPLNGAQSMKFVHPGGASNGGGYADSDYMPCGYAAPFRLSWLLRSTVAVLENQVIIRYFDKDKVTISADATIYDSTTNPITATQFSAICNPPTTAKFFKVRLAGGVPYATTTGGTTIFDAVTVERVRIRTYTVPSAVASVVFTDIRDSKKMRLDFNNATPSSAGTIFGLQVSADNGTTWLTSSSYYSGTTSATSISLGQATNEIMGGITLKNLGVAGYTMYERSVLNVITATPDFVVSGFGSGAINTSTAYNAIRVIPAAGTIDSGTFILEELY